VEVGGRLPQRISLTLAVPGGLYISVMPAVLGRMEARLFAGEPARALEGG